jgi:hypothetical protein
MGRGSSDKPKKKPDGLTDERKALYKHAKWLYFMAQSSERAWNGVRERNNKRPEFASNEAKGFYEGQLKAYQSALNSLINACGLPPIKKILEVMINVR